MKMLSVGPALKYRASQVLKSVLRDLIPELILGQKRHIHMGPFGNGLGVMIWYGYTPSAWSVRQTLMRGTQKRAEILLVLVRGLDWTTPIIFSCSSTFRCT